jgi:hypothetical protein
VGRKKADLTGLQRLFRALVKISRSGAAKAGPAGEA